MSMPLVFTCILSITVYTYVNALCLGFKLLHYRFSVLRHLQLRLNPPFKLCIAHKSDIKQFMQIWTTRLGGKISLMNRVVVPLWNETRFSQWICSPFFPGWNRTKRNKRCLNLIFNGRFRKHIIWRRVFFLSCVWRNGHGCGKVFRPMGETSHRSLIKGNRAVSGFRRNYVHQLLLPYEYFHNKAHQKPNIF